MRFFWTLIVNIIVILLQLPIWIWILGAIMVLPVATALPEESSFPDLSFKVFSKFIKHNFASEITLSQVLLILFTLTENTELLSLHARQQNPKYQGENHTSISGWIKCLARGLQEKLGDDTRNLFKQENVDSDDIVSEIGGQLDGMAKLLQLYPYNSEGSFKGKLKPISYDSIQAVHVICPTSVVCETLSCRPRSLLQKTKLRDIPRVTLIKGLTTYTNVQVLTGYCPTCHTRYFADHERVQESDTQYTKVYLHSAKYLKVGQTLWVDRVFSNAVVNGMYSFHASASAYLEFWNNSFGTDNSKHISRRHVWQAFVQETTRTIASSFNINLQLPDNLAIEDVTKEAFTLLGENGIIRAANQHSCGECTQHYRHTADTMPGVDPAAVVGIDENRVVPGLAEAAAPVISELANYTSTVDQIPVQSSNDEDMDVDSAFVQMIVVDGIVMGPVVCICFI
jgi:hypothetical protein